jgi:hypothetical protein
LAGKKAAKRKAAASPEVDLATAIGNPWRFRILTAAMIEPVSPSQFVREHGGEISNISRHFRQLAKWGYMDVVDRKSGGPRRGGVEHLYRAVRSAHLDTASSRGLPPMIRGDISNTVVATFIERVVDATEAGTLDADVERNLSWDIGELDREAFRQLSVLLDDVIARMPALRAESKERMADSGEEPIPTTVGLFSFRSPSIPVHPSTNKERVDRRRE